MKKIINVLDNISVSFEVGKFYAIMGHSGCGKSTLIKILGLLENITSGTYEIKEKDIKNINSREEANLRKNLIGLIFQDFYLDEYLNAYENVMYPMLNNKNILKDTRKQLAISLLEKVDLNERINHFPRELSGGEQQRVAIARALVNDPLVILADEPTGNLDEDNEKKIFSILKSLSQSGKCVIVVSHSSEVQNYADIIYTIQSGKLLEVNK